MFYAVTSSPEGSVDLCHLYIRMVFIQPAVSYVALLEFWIKVRNVCTLASC